MSKARKAPFKRLDWRLNRNMHPPVKRKKAKKVYPSAMEDAAPRDERRAPKSVRFRVFRDVYIKKDTGEKILRYWEWRPTQTPPMKTMFINRNRKKVAKKSRKANR